MGLAVGAACIALAVFLPGIGTVAAGALFGAGMGAISASVAGAVSDYSSGNVRSLGEATKDMVISMITGAITGAIGAAFSAMKWFGEGLIDVGSGILTRGMYALLNPDMSTEEKLAYVFDLKQMGVDFITGVAMHFASKGVTAIKSKLTWNKSGSKGGTDVRNRQGRPVLATEKTLDMALDPETYANTIAEKYGINLRGSGQSITIKYNADLRPGIYGRTTAANPYVIEIGSDALVSEEELANTIAHELNHARDFIRGGIAPESSAYSSGNALSDYIMGGR